MAPRKSKVAWEETFTGRIISLLSLSITGFTKIFFPTKSQFLTNWFELIH